MHVLYLGRWASWLVFERMLQCGLLMTVSVELFSICDKAKPDTGDIRGLNLAAVMFMTVQVSRLPLWRELLVSSRA
jgi:hypothetical protein